MNKLEKIQYEIFKENNIMDINFNYIHQLKIALYNYSNNHDDSITKFIIELASVSQPLHSNLQDETIIEIHKLLRENDLEHMYSEVFLEMR